MGDDRSANQLEASELEPVGGTVVGQHYSHTVWIVKPGQEAEFVKRWSAFEEWSAAEGLSARGKLLQDVDEPRRFISFGPWETLQAIRRWRMLPDFQEHARRLGEVLEQFDAHTLEEVVER
jgi:heme-degrading monooxygenase HmoA